MRRLPTSFLSEQRRQLWKINSISRMPWDSFCGSLCNPLCLWNIFTPRTEIRMSLCRISSRGQKVHWHNFLICCFKKKNTKVQHKMWWWQVEGLVDWVQKSVFCIRLVGWLSVRHGNQWWWWWEMVDRTWEEYYKLSEPGFKSQLCYWIEMSPSSSASLSRVSFSSSVKWSLMLGNPSTPSGPLSLCRVPRMGRLAQDLLVEF